MMQSIRRSLLYFCSAIALCFSGLGFAADAPAVRYVSYVIADQGDYGLQATKCAVEMAYMVSLDSVRSSTMGDLTAEGNGFRLASMTSREVAGGMTGSTGTATPVV